MSDIWPHQVIVSLLSEEEQELIMRSYKIVPEDGIEDIDAMVSDIRFIPRDKRLQWCKSVLKFADSIRLECADDFMKEDRLDGLMKFIQKTLNDKIISVHSSGVLTDKPIRLVNSVNEALNQGIQGVDFSERQIKPYSLILEINPKNEIISDLNDRLNQNPDDKLLPIVVEQLFENELLSEGITIDREELKLNFSKAKRPIKPKNLDY